MAYDEALAERIRAETDRRGGAEEKKMFGGLAFFFGGNMAVAASGQGGLLVRVSPDDTERMVREPGARVMEMSGRVAKGWIRVADDVLDGAALTVWVDRGVDYASSLPPK